MVLRDWLLLPWLNHRHWDVEGAWIRDVVASGTAM